MNESEIGKVFLSWPHERTVMNNFVGIKVILYFLLILIYFKVVNSLDILVSQVGPEADFREASSRKLDVEEGKVEM